MLWYDHIEALRETPLIYIDALMDEIVAAEPMYKDELKDMICRLIPDMPLGTPRRLIDLKYAHLEDGECINVEALFE